jgi:hypothetical protein
MPALRAKKPPNLLIDVIPFAPIRPAEATPNHPLTDPNEI